MIASKTKRSPCPVCKGQIVLERGDFVSVGVGMMQVSADLTCGWCVDGFMEVGSKEHWKWRQPMLIHRIWMSVGTEDEWAQGKFMDENIDLENAVATAINGLMVAFAPEEKRPEPLKTNG